MVVVSRWNFVERKWKCGGEKKALSESLWEGRRYIHTRTFLSLMPWWLITVCVRMTSPIAISHQQQLDLTTLLKASPTHLQQPKRKSNNMLASMNVDQRIAGGFLAIKNRSKLKLLRQSSTQVLQLFSLSLLHLEIMWLTARVLRFASFLFAAVKTAKSGWCFPFFVEKSPDYREILFWHARDWPHRPDSPHFGAWTK